MGLTLRSAIFFDLDVLVERVESASVLYVPDLGRAPRSERCVLLGGAMELLVGVAAAGGRPSTGADPGWFANMPLAGSNSVFSTGDD